MPAENIPSWRKAISTSRSKNHLYMCRWAGGTAVIVGIGNAYYGMNISLPATRYFAGYSAALGGWLLIAAIGQAFVYSSVGYEEAPLVQHSKRDQKPAIATTQA